METAPGEDACQRRGALVGRECTGLRGRARGGHGAESSTTATTAARAVTVEAGLGAAALTHPVLLA